MLTELLLLLSLIVLNGLFAMAEIAIVSSKRARLKQLAGAGNAGAQAALRLTGDPTRFLSSVQVGITSIGILNGALGEASVATRLRVLLEQWPPVAPYAEAASLALMVIALTYVSLIVGELVPKRLALTRPEAVAAVVARPMELVASIAGPIVRLLSMSTNAVLRAFRVRESDRSLVTTDEIRILLEQGAEEGVLERAEHEMMTNVLRLDEHRVGGILTPRADVVYLDLRATEAENLAKLQDVPHSVLPLCDGGLDTVVGLLRSGRLLSELAAGHPLDLKALAEPPLFVPGSIPLSGLLEQLKRARLPVALVVDEFGVVRGLISVTDIVAEIVGNLGEPADDDTVVRRADGSWLLDGGLAIDTVEELLGGVPLLEDEDRPHHHTLGGLAMLSLGRVPASGDTFTRAGFRFEVVDMDGKRVDKVLVSTTAADGVHRQ